MDKTNILYGPIDEKDCSAHNSDSSVKGFVIHHFKFKYEIRHELKLLGKSHPLQ